jgi:hypothetical protein
VTKTAAYRVDLGASRIPAAGLLVGGLVLAHLPAGVGLPCPLRSLTGVPCPFCGTTTSIRALFNGHAGAALSAAPLGLVLVLVAALATLRLIPRAFALPRLAIAGALLAEWLFELHRYRFF